MEKFGEMGFFRIRYPEVYGGLNLDLFYTVIFFRRTSKN
jgi:alkylation response protein AidB-like acyl-CoA dehydrogenase